MIAAPPSASASTRSMRNDNTSPPSASRALASVAATVNGGRSRSTVVEPAVQRGRQPRALGRGHGRRQRAPALRSERGARRRHGGFDAHDQSVVGESGQRGVVAHVVPERLQRPMQQDAALVRTESRDRCGRRARAAAGGGRTPGTRTRSGFRRCPRRRGPRCRRASGGADRVRQRVERWPGPRRSSATRPARASPAPSHTGHAANSGDASAGDPSTAVAWLAVTSCRGLRERDRRRLRERERMRGIGARDAARALPRERQQRIGRDARRPALGGHAGQPQRVELESGRLEDAEDLDARGRRLRLEHDARDQRAQRAHGVVARERPHQPAERGKRTQRVEQPRARLPLAAAERPVAGPAERREPRAPRVGPCGRRRARRRWRSGVAPPRGQRDRGPPSTVRPSRARTARPARRPRATAARSPRAAAIPARRPAGAASAALPPRCPAAAARPTIR